MAKRNRIQSLFAEYAGFHQTVGNQTTHFIGIPLIVFSLFGLLGQVRLGPLSWEWTEYLRLDLGWVLFFVAMPWYLWMDTRLAIPFAFVMLGLNFFARAFSVPVLITCFVIGWSVQFYGHIRYEKRSPAFAKNLQHLLVGPFWILSKILEY